jgi:L-histidine Nalpha-methyltransferase
MRNNLTTLQITDLSTPESGTGAKAQFAEDVKKGLAQEAKKLSSRYFYDGEGSRLFQKIMHLPEYYLTRSEHEVFTTQQQTIAQKLAAQGYFHLIDLGAGDATKTTAAAKRRF